MAGIIKNQLLKHLSRFVKDLSSDRINVSTLKGEGELTNLNLDEETLTDLLALPTWMKIKKASCNRVNIRIPWTRLKSHPILLALDHVHVQIETCEELRKTAADAANHFASSAGKYGFVNKVVDGITLTVESVEMTFHSREFESRVQISRIRVESRSPQWRGNVELSHSRLKDVRRGEVLVFKEVVWQNLRLEAQSTSDRHLAPLRLLTNQAKARIVIKKRLNDCQVVACRLSVILDELLWVLTDSQILAALHFINSLSGLVKQATEESQRIKAKRKLETLPEYQAQQHQATAMNSSGGGGGSANDAARIFEAFDIKETSYHFNCEKINLHLLDDPGNGRSIHPDLTNGAALQIHFAQIMLDFYPYHLARASRKSWPRYGENQVFNWLKEAVETFNIKLMETILPSQQQQHEHKPLTRAPGGGGDNMYTGASPAASATSHNSTPGGVGGGTPVRNDNNHVRIAIGEKISKLMSTCLVVRIQNICIYKVTTNAKESLQPFLSGYMERPKDLHGIHIEFTWFYHPGEVCFPLPSPKIYAHFHPIQIDLDVCTVLWLNAFASNLTDSLNKAETAKEEPYTDIRLELIQPKILYRSKPYMGQMARPTAIYFQLSRVILANYRSGETGTREELVSCLDKVGCGVNSGNRLRANSTFSIHVKPNYSNYAHVDKLDRFHRHCNNEDLVKQNQVHNMPKRMESFADLSSLTKEMMWTEPRDIWYLRADSFWSDFCFDSSPPSSGNGRKRAAMARFESIASETGGIWGAASGDQLGPPSPFIDPVPLNGWIYVPPPPSAHSAHSPAKGGGNGEGVGLGQSSEPLCVLLNSISMVNVQMTHYQYLFLMRMVESFGELSLFLNLDTERVIGELAAKLKEMLLMLYIPRIEVSFLFPSLPIPAHLPRDNSLASDNGTHSSPSPSTDFPTCTPHAVMMMQSTLSEPSLAYQQVNQNGQQNTQNQQTSLDNHHPLMQQLGPSSLENKSATSRSVHTLLEPTSAYPPPGKMASSLSVSASPINKPMPTLDVLTDNFKQGMKQGLSTVFAFSKAGGLSTPDSEVASTFSTSGSSDNIQFEHLDLEGETVGLDENVEVAMEVMEDHEGNINVSLNSNGEAVGGGQGPLLNPPQNHVPNGPRSQEYGTVNVLSIQLGGVVVQQEAKALDSDIAVTAAYLEFDEAAELQWQEFQRRFIARSKKWKSSQQQHQQSESSYDPLNSSSMSTNGRRLSSSLLTSPGGKNVVQVFLSQKIDGNMVKAYDWRADKSTSNNGGGSSSNSGVQKFNMIDTPGGDSLMRKLIIDATQPSLKAVIDFSQGQELVFNMSSVVNLTDLVEDEIIPVPFPFEISVAGGKIKLIEDRPPVNMTSPGAPPIKVSILEKLHISRDEYGVIYVGKKRTLHKKDRLKSAYTDSAPCDLLKSLTVNDYRGDDEEEDLSGGEDAKDSGSSSEEFLKSDNESEGGQSHKRPERSPDEKRLRKLNKVILQMEEKLKELKSEKCNLILRINCNQTEQIINKQN